MSILYFNSLYSAEILKLIRRKFTFIIDCYSFGLTVVFIHCIRSIIFYYASFFNFKSLNIIKCENRLRGSGNIFYHQQQGDLLALKDHDERDHILLLTFSFLWQNFLVCFYFQFSFHLFLWKMVISNIFITCFFKTLSFLCLRSALILHFLFTNYLYF